MKELPDQEMLIKRVKSRLRELEVYSDLQELQNICETQKSLSTKKILGFIERLKSKSTMDHILFENLLNLTEKQKEVLMTDKDGNKIHLGDRFLYGSARDEGEVITLKGRVVVKWKEGDTQPLEGFYWDLFDTPFITKIY